MKGLVRNNFSASYTNAKVFSVFMLILGTFVVAVISQPLLIGYVLIGTLFAGAGVSLSWLLHDCPFDLYSDIFSMFALGISMSLFTGAIFFPMFYLGGEERSEVFLVIALLSAFGLDLVITTVINILLDPGIMAAMLGAAALLVSSLLAFVLSCPLSAAIFKKREY